MILELASILGTSVGGKVFGIVGDMLSERRHQHREQEDNKHKQQLAIIGATKEYQHDLHEQKEDGTYSPLSWVIAISIGLFAFTYCAAALTCFFDDPTAIVYTKDPSEEANNFSFLFGFIEWDIANNRVVSMSKIGLGYLMLHPIVFILSMVTTGDKLKRR